MKLGWWILGFVVVCSNGIALYEMLDTEGVFEIPVARFFGVALLALLAASTTVLFALELVRQRREDGTPHRFTVLGLCLAPFIAVCVLAQHFLVIRIEPKERLSGCSAKSHQGSPHPVRLNADDRPTPSLAVT